MLTEKYKSVQLMGHLRGGPRLGTPVSFKDIEEICMKRIRLDKQAGLEGLPLYLLIMVIVAAVGIAILLGWMGAISAPKAVKDITIETTPDPMALTYNVTENEYWVEGASVTVTVKDQEGNTLSGADVRLSSSGSTIRAWSSTDSNYTTSVIVCETDNQGSCTFDNLRLSVSGSDVSNPQTWSADVDVVVTKTDYTQKTVSFIVYAEA